jgi:hypothetical protein
VFLGRVVGGGDPAWLDTDRALALAWQAEKNSTCSCGTRDDEWVEDRAAYVGATAYCRGHELLAMQAEALPKDTDGRPLPGFFARLVRREIAEAGLAAQQAPER